MSYSLCDAKTCTYYNLCWKLIYTTFFIQKISNAMHTQWLPFFVSTTALQLLQQISSYIFKTSYIISEFYPVGRGYTKGNQRISPTYNGHVSITAKRTTTKSPAKQNMIYTLRLYMVTHYHKQRASKGIHVYMRACVVSQGEGCGLICSWEYICVMVLQSITHPWTVLLV